MIVYEHPDGYVLEVETTESGGFYLVAIYDEDSIRIPIGQPKLIELVSTLQALITE